uniref:Uncharacterized protein n=1 Tax=Medicago truncatula TaxID=3880 RepID=I3SBA5_MEDTR|nr:unknown [Medicago truncatula]
MQTHKQEYGSFHQRNIQAIGQSYHVSALIPLKPGPRIPHQAVYWHLTS